MTRRRAAHTYDDRVSALYTRQSRNVTKITYQQRSRSFPDEAFPPPDLFGLTQISAKGVDSTTRIAAIIARHRKSEIEICRMSACLGGSHPAARVDLADLGRPIFVKLIDCESLQTPSRRYNYLVRLD